MHLFPLTQIQHPELIMDGAMIQTVDEHTFLGLTFDSKLLFIPHIKALKAKALKSFNLMTVVSQLGCGGDSTVLLRLYRASVVQNWTTVLLSTVSKAIIP